MSMTIMPETSISVATIRYGMPTTMPARGHAYDAQQEFAYSQLSKDPARDEWGAGSFGMRTTTKSNIYGYVNGNPVSFIDPLRHWRHWGQSDFSFQITLTPVATLSAGISGHKWSERSVDAVVSDKSMPIQIQASRIVFAI